MPYVENQCRVFKVIRKTMSLTQKELAQKLNVHPQFISNIERAKCAIPFKTISDLLKTIKPKSKRLEMTKEMMMACGLDYKERLKIGVGVSE